MAVPKSSLDTHLRTVRLIAEHRQYEAEKKMLEDFSECYTSIHEFLGVEYAKYAQDDKLTYEILQQKGEYARFCEEVVNKYEGITQAAYNTVNILVNDTYKLCYQGMVDAVTKNGRASDLASELKSIRAVTSDIIKRSVENPIPKLKLSTVLQRNRKAVIAGIKREITVGLSLGDRMSTMAERITKQVKTNYTQSMLIARTEAHRVREGGFNDAASRIDEVLKDNNSEYRMVKTWHNRKDSAVRHTNLANHVQMEGQTVLQDEQFTLVQSGAKADHPGASGVAAEDCNCRCFLTTELMNDAEFFAATGRHFDGSTKQTTKPKKPATEKKIETSVDELKTENFPAAFTATTAEKKNTQMLADYVNSLDRADPNVVSLYNKMGKMESVVSEGVPFKISHGSDYAVNSKYYISSGKYAEVKLTIPKIDSNNLIGAVNTTLHEEMHLMDLFLREDRNIRGAFTESKTLASRYITAVKTTNPTIGSKVKNVFKQFKEEYDLLDAEKEALKARKIQELKDDMFPDGKDFWSCSFTKFKEYEKRRKKVAKEIEEEYGWKARGIMEGGIDALQDIYDALNGGRYRGNEVMYGHGIEYYKSFSNRTSEILANYGALSVTRPDLIELLREDKPELVASLEQLIKDMIKKVK